MMINSASPCTATRPCRLGFLAVALALFAAGTQASTQREPPPSSGNVSGGESDAEAAACISLATRIRNNPAKSSDKDLLQLTPCLQYEYGSGRQVATDIFRTLGGRSVPTLITALYDKNDFVGEGAAQALGLLGPEAEPAIPSLMDVLRKAPTYSRVAPAAAGAIGEIRGPDPLVRIASGDEPGIRKGLGLHGLILLYWKSPPGTVLPSAVIEILQRPYFGGDAVDENFLSILPPHIRMQVGSLRTEDRFKEVVKKVTVAGPWVCLISVLATWWGPLPGKEIIRVLLLLPAAGWMYVFLTRSAHYNIRPDMALVVVSIPLATVGSILALLISLLLSWRNRRRRPRIIGADAPTI